MSVEPHAAPPLPVPAPADPGLPPTPADAVPATPAVLAQILATEHWSLLATRSVLWGELMNRISIHLTVSSAALVVLALVAQATGFGTGFWVMAIGLSAVLLVLGTLTLVRVSLGSEEDHNLIVGMNRLRGAYAELAPEVRGVFVTSGRDDRQGIFDTYWMGATRTVGMHAVSSTAFFLACFNSMVAGTLAALVTHAAGGGTALVAVIGALGFLAYLGVGTLITAKRMRRIGLDSRFPGDSNSSAPSAG